MKLSNSVVATLTLPAWAIMPSGSPGSVVELTSQNPSVGNWRHIDDLSISNQPGTSEDLLAIAKEKVALNGTQCYQVTRL